MTTLVDTQNEEKEGFAVVFFNDTGFELLSSNIKDVKLQVLLTNYPSLMGILQNQEIEGLATTKLSRELFLFAYAITVKNLDAKDIRLKKKTVTIINFVVNREIYKDLMLYFDELENFLEDYFQPISFIFDLYALDFKLIIPTFLDRQREIHRIKKEEKEKECSLAIEFNKWLSKTKFEKNQ
ncbi:MAG: hypothetical protein ACFFDS_02475 [Candidatus Thorarchaeota archaeon]